MWRRIHSNRDPRDTLYSELRREFGNYFNRVIVFSKSLFGRYPKLIFSVMVISLSASLILSFTLFRHPEPKLEKAAKVKVNPVQDGFGEILLTTGKIRETLNLKHLVDSISGQKQLSAADSVLLDSALTRLQQIHNTIK